MSIYEDTLITIYFCVIAAVLGAALGSFLNCAAWRIAREESFLKGRSRCPSCGHELGAQDLIPVLSWVLLRGKCRYCKTAVPARYPLTECFFAVLTVLCLLQSDLTVICGRNLIFLCCLFCLSLVDLEIFIIPDGCLITAAGAWALGALIVPEDYGGVHGIVMNVAAGLVIGGAVLVISLVMDRVLGRDSLGGGDIKLFAVMGLYLGFVGAMFSLILSCIIGLVFAAVSRGRGEGRNEAERDEERDEDTRGHIPFGPSIAAATCFMLLFGEQLVDWYMGLIF